MCPSSRLWVLDSGFQSATMMPLLFDVLSFDTLWVFIPPDIPSHICVHIHIVSSVFPRSLILASQVPAPAGCWAASPDRLLHIHVSQNRRRIYPSFLLSVQQAVWICCICCLLLRIRSGPLQNWSAQMHTWVQLFWAHRWCPAFVLLNCFSLFHLQGSVKSVRWLVKIQNYTRSEGFVDCDIIRWSASRSVGKGLWFEHVPFSFTFVNWYWHLYFLYLYPTIFRAIHFQKLFSSPQHAHVTFFVNGDKLELAVWLLCSMHAVIQVYPNRAVGCRNWCLYFPTGRCFIIFFFPLYISIWIFRHPVAAAADDKAFTILDSIIAYINSSSLLANLSTDSCHTIPVLAHSWSSTSVDPRLFAFCTLLFFVKCWSSKLTLPSFWRGSCHVKSARFVLLSHIAEISLHEIALSAWIGARIGEYGMGKRWPHQGAVQRDRPNTWSTATKKMVDKNGETT